MTPSPPERSATKGPLRVHPGNPRYFADTSGKAILLAGSHTWATLQEAGPVDPPDPFDWQGWLEFMVDHDHNFMRLWTWENAKWGSWWDGDYYFTPIAWARTGPGLARDGKPRFDLTRFDEDWFGRLRSRVIDLRERGIYTAVMLFQGWSGGDIRTPRRGRTRGTAIPSTGTTTSTGSTPHRPMARVTSGCTRYAIPRW